MLHRGGSLTYRVACVARSQIRVGRPSRPMSARTHTEGDALKKQLRKFYRRVHPDLFSTRPSEKRVNEASFKLLMSMMQESDTSGSLPTAQFRLDFFVMPPKAEASEAEIVCSKVSVDVALGSSSSARKATVRSALHSLLSQSGLVDKEEAHSAHTAAEPPSEGNWRESLRSTRRDLGGDVVVEPTSLANFISTYADLARQRREAYESLDREVGLLRSMLVISFRVRVAYDVGSTPPTLEAQADLVAQLHEAITAVGPSVHESTVCLSSSPLSSPIDEAGRIALPIGEPDKWVELLKSVKPQELRAARERYEAIVARAKACASVLGIGSVEAESFKFSAAPEYDRFLIEVIRAGERGVFAHLNRNLYGQLTLRVRRITQAEFSIAVDPTCGFVVPYDLAPAEMAAFMRDNSATLLRTFKKLDMEHKRDDDMLRFVRRQLMAHGIRKDESVTPQQMREALSRLRAQESLIGPYLRSVDLRVGTQYRVHEDGTMELPWDFNKR